MSLNILVPQFLLPHSSVRLGRFITNIDYPHQSHHDPPYAETPKPTVSPRESYIGLDCKSSNTSFGSALTSLMSAGFSNRAKTQVQVKADCVTTYTLDNSDEWFTEATGMPSTRTWIERAVDRGHDIYMIVGYHTVTNARIVHEFVREKGAGGQINVPVGLSLAAVGAIVPLGEIIDPSAGGNSHRLDDTRSFFRAPGEQICAFQYRKVRHRWLSSNSIDTSRLSKSPRWSSVERGRDEEDGEDDIIEVETIPVEELDGRWQRQEVLGGEILLIRMEEEREE